jgi:hypothetical protein
LKKLLLIIATIVFLTSCSKKGDEPTPQTPTPSTTTMTPPIYIDPAIAANRVCDSIMNQTKKYFEGSWLFSTKDSNGVVVKGIDLLTFRNDTIGEYDKVISHDSIGHYYVGGCSNVIVVLFGNQGFGRCIMNIHVNRVSKDTITYTGLYLYTKITGIAIKQ